MILSGISTALGVAALLGFVVFAELRRRYPLSARSQAIALSALAVLALLFHLHVPREDDGLRWSAPYPHVNEYLHHYLGTRYFNEVGYTGLYAAGVLADWEDDREHFRGDAPMRDLATYRLVPRSSVLAEAETIRSHFAPERWTAFKRDLAVLRGTAPPAFWHGSGYFVDHGYNGTPLVTAISGGLASQPWLDTRSFIDLARFLDLYLIGLLVVAVAALEGAVAGLTFAFFLFANPLYDSDFVGGAYLRTEYLVFLALALLALRRGWLATSGACFAFSGLLRIFPLVFPGLLLLRDLVPRDRAQRLRRRARLHASFALTALVLLGVTSLQPGPERRNPWLDFADNLRLHAGTFGGNQIGLQVPFRYSPAADVRGGADATLAPPDWSAELARTLAGRRIPLALCAVALLAVALWSLRRQWASDASCADVFFAGLLILFAAVPLAHYYYAVLGLIPLVGPGDLRRQILLAAALLALTISAAPGLLPGSQDLHFAVFSVEVGVFLLLAVLVGAGLTRAGRRSAALATAAFTVVLAGSGCSPESKPFVPIRGDQAVSHALGFAITKPSDWVFLPVSSLRHDRGERAVTIEEIYDLFDKPAVTPLLEMAPRAEPRPGVDPVVRVRAVPLKPGLGQRTEQMLFSKPVTVTILSMRDTRERDHPELTVKAPAEAFSFAGRSGARMRLAYTEQGADGTPHPVEERLYHAIQGRTMWWVEMVAPAPMSPEIEQNFDRILTSLRIDA